MLLLQSPKKSLRIAIIGQSLFAAEVFKLLQREGHEVVAVFTVLDKGNREDPLGKNKPTSNQELKLRGTKLLNERYKTEMTMYIGKTFSTGYLNKNTHC